jgi:hypothetical protein
MLIQEEVTGSATAVQQQCISDALVNDCEAGSAVGWLSSEGAPPGWRSCLQ